MKQTQPLQCITYSFRCEEGIVAYPLENQTNPFDNWLVWSTYQRGREKASVWKRYYCLW